MSLHRFQVRHLQNRDRRPSGSRRFAVPSAVRGTFGKLQRMLPFKSWQKLPPKKIFIRLCIAGCSVVLLYLAYLWITLPDISDPRSFLASQSTVITDRNDVELYRLYQEEDRTFIDGALIPDHLRHAVISIEDERYYERGCLDIRALLRMAVRLGRAGGASTLTRQLARNALKLKRENVYNRKIKELILGCQMEGLYSKDELVNLYLNWIPFGQNAYGVEQASKAYFNSAAQDLTLAQSVVLAALPQRPTYFSPYGSHVRTKVTDSTMEQILSGEIASAADVPDNGVRIGLLGNAIGSGASTLYIGGRTDQVLKNMQDQGWITEPERQAALNDLADMEFQPSRESIRAPHFSLWIKQQVEDMFAGTSEEGLLERGGLQIQTTLDWELQQHAESAVEFHREDLVDRFGAQNMALMSVLPDTREIVAYVGNMDYGDKEHGGKIDMVQAPRQPGSSFKPFVYAASFERGYSPATILFDVETEIGGDKPQNFDGLFMGPMSIRQALGASRNIPAAKAFFLTGGEDRILQLVSSLGATTPLTRRTELNREREGGFGYGWPLALGAAETPLMEMVHAYSTMADGGIYKPLISIRKISDKHGNILFQAEQETAGDQVLDERIAYQVASILSDESVRPDEYWKQQLTVPGFQTAAKTGTSNKCLETKPDGSCRLRKPDNAWLVGYTPELVTGVWVGNADSTAMFDKAGGLNSASPIWRDYMMRAHKTMEVTRTTFNEPDGIVKPQVSLLSGKLPTECTPVELRRADVFLRENAPVEPDSACLELTVDKVTGLLASDECPEDAQEEQSFFAASSILPERWPSWEEGVQNWMREQMELWNATENHSGSLLKLPRAPTEVCDPGLTPGRLKEPSVSILSPLDSGMASYPAFTVTLDYEVGSEVREVKVLLDGKRVASEQNPPFSPTIRVPRSVKRDGLHTLEVELTDEYYNVARDSVNIRFGEDKVPPTVRILKPSNRSSYPNGSAVTVRAQAEDKEGGIKYVQFYLDGVLLSTKPKEPFELTFTLDTTDGMHTLRAVAEDIAKHRTEDSIQISVGGEPLPPPSEPTLLEPANDVSLSEGDMMDVSVLLPEIGGDIYQVHLFVRNEQTQQQDVLLGLSDGSGEYHRSWKAGQPGSYTLVLRLENRNREMITLAERSVEVE